MSMYKIPNNYAFIDDLRSELKQKNEREPFGTQIGTQELHQIRNNTYVGVWE